MTVLNELGTIRRQAFFAAVMLAGTLLVRPLPAQSQLTSQWNLTNSQCERGHAACSSDDANGS